MPYIGTKTTVEITKGKEAVLKQRMAQAMEASIPGKTENWLMCEFCDNCRLWMAGTNDSPAAFVEVKILHSAKAEYYEKLSSEICKVLSEELDIPGDRVYITYSEFENWGWNSSNF